MKPWNFSVRKTIAQALSITAPNRAEQGRPLDALAAVEGDALGVVPQPHERVAERGAEELVEEVQADQRAPIRKAKTVATMT